MPKFRKKPVVVEATQWFADGDHPAVRLYSRGAKGHAIECDLCGRELDHHGLVNGRTVCPGDYIITGVQGEREPCKPDIFEATYERIEG